jgi:large subunit ribosomal protein L32
MAAPKKRTSKTRKNLRKSNWKAQASGEAKKALATAKRVLKSLEIGSENPVDSGN